jgi:hypothetical protein
MEGEGKERRQVMNWQGQAWRIFQGGRRREKGGGRPEREDRTSEGGARRGEKKEGREKRGTDFFYRSVSCALPVRS